MYLNTPNKIQNGDIMNDLRQEAAPFLDGLVIGFLIISVLIILFFYIDFILPLSYLLALFVGGIIAGIITTGTWKGGVSAVLAGCSALFLFEFVKGVLTFEYQFTTYQMLMGFLLVLAGGLLGGYVRRRKIIFTKIGEPQKIYVCNQCGAEIPMKTKFCPECGSRMGKPPITERLKGMTESDKEQGGDIS
jgi:DNA-directed RNA polymerase subunit RPC12/RpoP